MLAPRLSGEPLRDHSVLSLWDAAFSFFNHLKLLIIHAFIHSFNRLFIISLQLCYIQLSRILYFCTLYVDWCQVEIFIILREISHFLTWGWPPSEPHLGGNMWGDQGCEKEVKSMGSIHSNIVDVHTSWHLPWEPGPWEESAGTFLSPPAYPPPSWTVPMYKFPQGLSRLHPVGPKTGFL